MKKTDVGAFTEFVQDEAMKYRRAITAEEIATWFETFRRCTLEDFKQAWIDHKRDEKHGGFFPTIPMLQRALRVTGEENAKRDWRCAVEVGGLHCNYPGAVSEGVHGGGPWYCAAHFRLFQGELTKGAVQDASLQIAERSQDYKPPTTYDELYRLNDARRAGARKVREIQARRLAADPMPAATLPEPPDLGEVPLPDAAPFIEEAQA